MVQSILAIKESVTAPLTPDQAFALFRDGFGPGGPPIAPIRGLLGSAQFPWG